MTVHKEYRIYKPFIVLLVAIAIVCIPVKRSRAAEDKGGGAMVHSIAPVPAFNAADIDVQGAINRTFSGEGWIDRIGDGIVIINDDGYTLSDPDVVSGFAVGQYVGFKVNASGQISALEPLTPPKK